MSRKIKISDNTAHLLRRMAGADPSGTIDNRNWWGWAGYRVQRAAAIRAGWIKTGTDRYGRQYWTVTVLGRRVTGLATLNSASVSEIASNLATAQPIGG